MCFRFARRKQTDVFPLLGADIYTQKRAGHGGGDCSCAFAAWQVIEFSKLLTIVGGISR